MRCSTATARAWPTEVAYPLGWTTAPLRGTRSGWWCIVSPARAERKWQKERDALFHGDGEGLAY